MIEQSTTYSGEQQLRNLLDELALCSMSSSTIDAKEASVLCERLASVGMLASNAGLQDVCDLANSRSAELLASKPSEFVSRFRDSISALQEALEGSAEKNKFDAAPVAEKESVDMELVRDFIVESREHLLVADDQALALEKDPDDLESINGLFRAFHSIKGLAAFLDFDRVYRFAHEIETLLDYARNRELAVTPEVIDLILASADFLRQCMQAIEENRLGVLPPTEDALVLRIREAIEKCAQPVQPAEVKPEPAASPEPHVEHVEPAEQEPVHAARPQERIERDIAATSEAIVPVVPESLKPQTKETSAAKSSDDSKVQSVDSSSIRIDTSKLDYLMDMVGELVIAQSMVRTEVTEEMRANSNLLRRITQLSQISTEVQRTALRMRMVPVGQLLRRTGRIVRDLSRKVGKAIDIEVVGEDTEVDKTIAEELADPLMHIVRNAVDHGIETQEERIASGKPATAKVRLVARHEGGQIVVIVSDDGRGLDREKILKKASEKNLISHTDLSYAEVIELIFKPGFSTAEKVTTVSGRGVGMDVVRRHVEKLRGRVDVESQPGAGTTFAIRLPLTRAIIDGLIVKVGGARYVIPMSSVRELFRPTQENISTVQSRGELALLHNRLLPIVRLYRTFDVPSAIDDPCQAVLVVAESEGRQFCLMVDELLGKQEVVVKSLGHQLSNVVGISGGTILGDGTVGLILDVQQIHGKAS